MIYCTHALEKKREIIVPNEIIVSEIVARVRPLIYKCVKCDIARHTVPTRKKKIKRKKNPPIVELRLRGQIYGWVCWRHNFLTKKIQIGFDSIWIGPFNVKHYWSPSQSHTYHQTPYFLYLFFPCSLSLSLSLLFIIVKFYILLKY